MNTKDYVVHAKELHAKLQKTSADLEAAIHAVSSKAHAELAPEVEREMTETMKHFEAALKGIDHVMCIPSFA